MGNKKDINKSITNTIFGTKYLEMCGWLPWVALAIMVLGTKLNEQDRLRVWGCVGVVVIINAIYLVYRVLKYYIGKRKHTSL